MRVLNYKKYKLFAEKLSKEAGAILLNHLGKIKKISYKSKIDLVTDVDTKCERLILKRIKDVFSEHEIISEEAGTVGSNSSDYQWLIDPLDGTTNYAHSFGFFCVSIALLYKGEVIVGVVYDPLRDELFSASKDKGSYLNGKRISVSSIKSLRRSLLATGFPYSLGKLLQRNMDNFKRFILKSQAVRRAGSAALDLCYVAAGRFDGFWELGLHPWDTAAGVLIVQEAGGKVTTFNNKQFNPFLKEIVATNRSLHNKIIKVLR